MSPNKQKRSIAVVGAGLMGRLTALSLHRQGFEITLFDKDNKSGKQSAGYAAAGLLTPYGESIDCEPNIVEMGLESLKLWPNLLATLDEHVFFQQKGALMVSHEQDKGDFVRISRFISNHYCEAKLLHLDRNGIESIEPELGRSFNQGLFLPDEGQIGNRRLMKALGKQLEKDGVQWKSRIEVENIESLEHSGNITYHYNDVAQEASFDLVIDCRGTGAIDSNHIDEINKLKDLRAVRGELFQLYAPNVRLNRPVRLMHPRYQLYIAPKGKGYFVVGATEIESSDRSPMTVRSAMELLSAAYSVHPGFAEANIRQHVSQCRPAFSDNQPRIRVCGSVIQINGLYRHGFLIAPIVLKQIEELVENISKQHSPADTRYSDLSYSHLLKVEPFKLEPVGT